MIFINSAKDNHKFLIVFFTIRGFMQCMLKQAAFQVSNQGMPPEINQMNRIILKRDTKQSRTNEGCRPACSRSRRRSASRPRSSYRTEHSTNGRLRRRHRAEHRYRSCDSPKQGRKWLYHQIHP